MCNEVDAVSRDFSLFDKRIGNNAMRIIYLTLAIFFGHHFLGFPDFAPSATQLLLIGIGAGAAIVLGISWVGLRQIRRTSLLGGEIDCDKSSDA